MRNAVRTLAAALLVALALVLVAPRAARAANAGTEDDPIVVEVGGGASEDVTLGRDEYAWFAFKVEQEGDYAAWSEGDADACGRLSSYGHDDEAECDGGGDDLNFRSVFHAVAGSSWRLRVRDLRGSEREIAVRVEALDGASAGLTLGGVPEGEAVWLGEYDGAPVSWEQEGVPEGALGLRSRFVLTDACYHRSSEVSSCTGPDDTDLHTQVLPDLGDEILSGLELDAAGAMRLPGDPGDGRRRAWRRNGGEADYWLQGDLKDCGDYWGAPYVLGGDWVEPCELTDSLGVRPALDLDLSRVLLSSAAVGGKPATEPGALAPVQEGSGGAKLTLLDDARDGFEAHADAAEVAPGGTVSVAYEGAGTGTNEHVSAVLCAGADTPLYYGHLASGSASGTAEVALPEGLAPGSYTLRVFSEQCNGDYHTDYASAFSDIALTVVAPPAAQVLGHTLTLGGVIGMNTYLLLPDDVVADGSSYQVEYWDGEELAASARVCDVQATTKTVDGREYTCYGFTVTTAAKDMGTKFAMKVKGPDGYVDFADANGKTVAGGEGLAYAITDYLEERKDNGSENMKPLARDMLAYGAYAAHYFAVRGGSEEGLPEVEGFAGTVTASQLEEYSAPGNIAHFEYRGTTLVLEDRTSFRMYFRSDDTSTLNISHKASDGASGYTPLEIKAGHGAYAEFYYVEVPNIVAKRLDAMYDFTISNGTVTTTAHHGPFGYARWALGLEGRDDLRYLMSALYHYNQSAKTYFNSQQ